MIDQKLSPPNNPHVFGLDRFIPFFGIVEDRNDPLCLGRCKVRIFGVHPQDNTLVTTDQLPWAYPILPISGHVGVGGMGHAPVGPAPGTHVVGFFADGYDRQQPFFFGTIAGGGGHFNFGISQQVPPAGNDGKSAYGPQAIEPVAAPVTDLPTEGKDMYNKGAEIAAIILSRFPGLKDIHAAAIVGNLCGESKLQAIREGGSKTPPERGSVGIGNGFGWAQWTNNKPGGRYDMFLDYCASIGAEPTSVEGNMGYLLYELQNSFKQMISKLRQGGVHSAPGAPKGPHDLDTIEGAVGYVLGDFERPSEKYVNKTYPERIGHAKAILAAMNKSGAPVRSTAQPTNK